jgi:hypothetical protein
VNPNRVAAVRSKLSQAASAEEVTDALVTDVEGAFWEEAPEPYQRAYERLSADEETAAAATLRERASAAVVWQLERVSASPPTV